MRLITKSANLLVLWTPSQETPLTIVLEGFTPKAGSVRLVAPLPTHVCVELANELLRLASPRIKPCEPERDQPRPSECSHPFLAVYWNPHSQVVQCHRCGEVFDGATRVLESVRPFLSAAEHALNRAGAETGRPLASETRETYVRCVEQASEDALRPKPDPGGA